MCLPDLGGVGLWCVLVVVCLPDLALLECIFLT